VGRNELQHECTYQGAAADQSAELWDYFARAFGRPKRTYADGDSMGGAGALVAVEKYSDRFSGALVACGVAGVYPVYDESADLLAAGAYAAGVTQSDYDAIPLYHAKGLGDLVYGRIESPIKAGPVVRARFLDAWTEITGGPRPHSSQGWALGEMGGLWSLVVDDLSKGLGTNIGRHYQFSAASSINEDDFNSRAVRVTPGPLRGEYPPHDQTGGIKAPVIMLHTTGDSTVPLNEFQLNVSRIVARGEASLLSTQHCDFDQRELSSAFDDLVKWVETGVKAEGRAAN
jgi:pimeloyl-ACP methyl ester carboxylesterase